MSTNDNKQYTRDFINHLPNKVLFHPKITLLQVRIYGVIRSFMDNNCDAYCSNNWLATQCGVNRDAVIKGINALVKYGFIKRRFDGEQRYLEIVTRPIAIVDENGQPSIPKDTPHSIPKDTPPSIPKDTQIDQSNNRSNTNINTVDSVESPPDDYKACALFMAFYSLYPRKEKPRRAYKAFLKLKPTQDFVSMLCMDVQQRVENNWKNRHKSKIPHPSTYLNDREWESEIFLDKSPVKKSTIDNNDMNYELNQRSEFGF